MNSEYMYTPSDADDEIFLSEVPVDIIMSSIETQFEEPMEYRKKDYIQSFITKYNLLLNNTTEVLASDLEDMHDRFFSFIENIFYEKLHIGFVNIDDMSDDDMHELVHMTYRFFIKNIKKNFVNIVKNYISDNGAELLSNFEKKKDVTALNFKSELDNEYDILILSELGNIIDYIFEKVLELNIEEFLEYCDDGEYSLELEFVKDAFDKDELSGLFVPYYVDFLTPDFKVEIQAKIRNKILKKYPKRERRNLIQEEEPDVNEDDNTDGSEE